MKKLVDKLEKHYQLRDEEFRLGGEGEGGEGEEEEEGGGVGRSEFFISGDSSTKRAVHMPGYPE